jgi:hypothetical protein
MKSISVSKNAPHVAKPIHSANDVFDYKVNFSLSGEPTNAESERGVSHVLGSACD